jgi:hypothetical protein
MRLFEAYVDGECAPKVIEGALDHLEKMLDQQKSRVREWRKRLSDKKCPPISKAA